MTLGCRSSCKNLTSLIAAAGGGFSDHTVEDPHATDQEGLTHVETIFKLSDFDLQLSVSPADEIHRERCGRQPDLLDSDLAASDDLLAEIDTGVGSFTVMRLVKLLKRPDRESI